MGKRFEQVLLKRRHKCHVNHQGNVLKPPSHHYSSTKLTQIKNNDNIKHWQGYRATETFLLHCWEEYKLDKFQSFLWSYTHTHRGLSNATPRHLPREMKTHLHTDLWHTHIAALFVVEQSFRYSATTQMSINTRKSYKWWYIHTTE